MKYSHRITWIALLVSLAYIGLTTATNLLNWTDQQSALTDVSTWQAAVSPKPLSQAHAFLENNCNACHTPVQGVPAANCIVCHANDESLLKRQPTAFQKIWPGPSSGR